LNYTPGTASCCNVNPTEPKTSDQQLTQVLPDTEWLNPILNLNKKKLNSEKSLKCKEKTIKNKIKQKNMKSTIISTQNSSTNVNTSEANGCNNGTNSSSSSSCNNNKKLLLKRSRKRSKPIVITPSVSHTNLITALAASTSTTTTQDDCFKKSELEPLNKKLAMDMNRNKNVDLQIEQFSQLDLHSSEEDSELFIR
jgi:hypothetical protein